MNSDDLPRWLNDPRRGPVVMGILNVTPDSFADGGKFISPDAALAHAEAMARDGADWIDVGAESTRPGSRRVSADDQLRRLGPLLVELRKRVSVVLSIDTTRALTAEAALDAGFDVVNDISAGRDDEALFPLIARRGAPIILMHMQGEPATMQHRPEYMNVTGEVSRFLTERIGAAEGAGIRSDQILIDPGIGFGKTLRHNLQLLGDLPELAKIGRPLVVGTSRKGFIEKVTGEAAATGRPFGTAATVAWSVARGAAAVRVHDVAAMARVVKMVQAMRSAESGAVS
ncbi:MAG TPA: dihydropteroate synthase [Tepidisphaeraceae bacterium]|nr:dihydropteroate synthase [Tepidisphaeraceae bacterium]